MSLCIILYIILYLAFLAAVCDFGGRPLFFWGVDSTESLAVSASPLRITISNTHVKNKGFMGIQDVQYQIIYISGSQPFFHGPPLRSHMVIYMARPPGWEPLIYIKVIYIYIYIGSH